MDLSNSAAIDLKKLLGHNEAKLLDAYNSSWNDPIHDSFFEGIQDINNLGYSLSSYLDEYETIVLEASSVLEEGCGS